MMELLASLADYFSARTKLVASPAKNATLWKASFAMVSCPHDLTNSTPLDVPNAMRPIRFKQ